jgi:hypothetical protein
MQSIKLSAILSFCAGLCSRWQKLLVPVREREFERAFRKNGISSMLNGDMADLYPLHVKPTTVRPSERVVRRVRFRD